MNIFFCSQRQILPNSIVRFNTYRAGSKPPLAWTVVAGAFMGLGGFGDVVLWVCTRPRMFGGEDRGEDNDKQEEPCSDLDMDAKSSA